MCRLRQLFMILVCLLLAGPLACYPQATEVDQITGTIQDASGAAVPNAQIRAIQTETGLIRTTSSGSDGSYVLSSLPIGPYRFESSATGFKTYIQTGIVLQVNVNPTINAKLEIGSNAGEWRISDAQVDQIQALFDEVLRGIARHPLGGARKASGAAERT